MLQVRPREINVRLWEIRTDGLFPVEQSALDKESRLEEWLARDLGMLGLDALLIGRQVETEHGGRIDVLAIDGSGELIIVEIKRDRTPRDIVAQTLDYATWVRKLTAPQIIELYRHKTKRDLAADFLDRYEEPLPESLNGSHKLYIVAASLDPATRRIVEYLSEVGELAINTALFQTFKIGNLEIIAADWLLDPDEVTERAESRIRPPWTGFWFVNVGPDPNIDWEDNRRYGYVGAGGGTFYSQRLLNLKLGDRFYAYRKKPGGIRGYVGLGEVLGEAKLPIDAEISGRPFLELDIKKVDFEKNKDDPALANYVMPVRWIKSVSELEGKRFKGAFANQNIACKLTDPATLEFLKREFSE
jgi:hypothetical protein